MSVKRKTAENTSANEDFTITVRPLVYEKRGVSYTSHVVQGWKENGKWQRKRFKDLADAEDFAATKRIELRSKGNRTALVQTTLTKDQADEAADALKKLGNDYTLSQAVEYFLENHRPPEYTIHISEALELYVDDKEREGVRSRTIRGIKGIIRAFSDYSEDPMVHEVSPQKIEMYLRGLRAKDGISTAKRKTWNNHRNELLQFFQWTAQEDLGTNRPWRFNNPVEKIKTFSADRVAEQRPEAATTLPKKVMEIFNHLMNYDEGSLVKVFALAYFAGIRPDIDGEMGKLSLREDELINLHTGYISIPADVAKTKHKRSIKISNNLKLWLKAYADKPIMPVNFSDKYTIARKPFQLQQDEARHSFISYHVALHRSVGDAALQAGNSEKMVRDHYLNLHTPKEGKTFFCIVPDMKKGCAKSDAKCVKTSKHPHLKIA